MEYINVTQSSMPPLEEYINEIQDIWKTKWLTNMGEKHKQLEVELRRYLHAEHITLFTNGHLALENIIKAMKLKGEVITTPFTFASTTHAITRNGLHPVFCDIKKDDYTIDENKIEELITDKTSAIIPVHVYGNICNYSKIEEIAKKYHLKVIYDAAHAFGVYIDGKSVAKLGDASMYSFHATKVFHTIEGGAVTYHEEELKDKLYCLKNFGITGYDKITEIGGNAKMNEFQAAMGICNLRYLGEEIKKRKKIFITYINRLEDVDGIQIPQLKENIKSNYSYFPILFDKYKKNRDEVFEQLKENGILSRKYFYPLTNHCEAYGYSGDRTPVAKEISEKILCVPIYADLQLDIVNKICDIIQQ